MIIYHKMECSICLENIDNFFYITTCNHIFHNKCINNCLKHRNSCPLCRKRLCKQNNYINSKLHRGIIVRYVRRIDHNNNKWTIGIDSFSKVIFSVPLWI